MPLLGNGDFSYKFADGRKCVFGIRDGKVKKISRPHLSDAEFRQALAEARKVLRPKSERVLLQKDQALCRRVDQGAAAADYHFRKMLPDF